VNQCFKDKCLKQILRIIFFYVLTISGEKVLKFFWFDAYEDRFKQPGNKLSISLSFSANGIFKGKHL